MKILVTLFLLITFAANAQDKLLLLNGRVDRGKILEDKENTFEFKFYKKGGKEKIIPYDKYRIFSVTNINGEERVLYKMDTTIGNNFTENQMRMYIYGQRDAHNNYGSGHHFILGFTLGFVGVILDTYETDVNGDYGSGFFKRSASIAPVLVPLVIPIGSSVFKSKIRKDDVSDIGYLNSEEYVEGFNKVKKFKKIKNTFVGSVLGMAVGFVSYTLAKPF